METVLDNVVISSRVGKPFGVIWAIELWERFGYYGVQAIITLYFVNQLGYSESASFYVFGSFTAFSYGFVWMGGWLGDKYLGTKCTMVIGAIVLMFSYAGLALANHHTIFYALAGIIIGSSLFKANPSSLISKMYAKGDAALDGAMTLYYMAVNVGSVLSMSITPIVAQRYGWSYAFWICSIGLLLGLFNYTIYRKLLADLGTSLDKQAINFKRIGITLICSILAIAIVAQLLTKTSICNWIVYCVVSVAFLYFLKIAFSKASFAYLGLDQHHWLPIYGLHLVYLGHLLMTYQGKHQTLVSFLYWHSDI